MLNPEDDLALRAIVNEMQRRAGVQLDGGDFESAAATLRALFCIEVIDNVHVTRMVEGVKDSVFARARDVERAALEAVMHARFDDADADLSRLEAVGGALQWAMPRNVDVGVMAQKMRVFLEMQRRRREDQRRMQEQLERMASEQADMRTKYAQQIALIEGQIKASEEQKRENDAQIARMKKESERAAEVRACARAAAKRGERARRRARARALWEREGKRRARARRRFL